MSYSYDENCFSDLYKDVHGVRPRGHRFYEASPEEKQEIWDFYCNSLVDVMAEEDLREAQAAQDFEALIAKNIELGAGDRKTAIRWIADSYDDNDGGYICYCLGISYSFEQEIQEAIN